ncbi:hypothetical protein [Dyadobacter diqingensis]|uniref:hypothetical protein n=1 Tax=Dyadobacter diqingensis TaxID=2938121 RepID=UPI0020C1FCCC|nr:hypothetical protein [Dyadobacter diqingensis]
MEGISYLTDDAGHKKAVVIDFTLLKDRDGLTEILEEIEDEIAVELRRDEPSFDWSEVKAGLMEKD